MIALFPTRTIAIEIAGFSIHWYGLLYLAAFAIAWLLIPRLQKYRSLSLSYDELSNILMWAVVGVIVGGRLGFVLFYQTEYYLSHPAEIFAVWNGGMASHGGFIGVAIALFFALRKRKDDILKIADVLVVPIAIGLALGRLGNFINQELYGIPTTLPWGIAVPDQEGLRHPTQIYAIIKDLFIAGVCFYHLRRPKPLPGRTFALFLMLYGVLRFIVEFFREQNGLYYGMLSQGQWLTLPIFITGVILWLFISKEER